MDLLTILNMVTNLGIDAGIVIFIIVTTNILKVITPINKKYTPLFTLILGLMIGIVQIFFAKIPSELWLRSILGYPGVSIAVYMLLKKYFLEKKENEKGN